MILQLSPALPVSTPKGNGIAHFLVDYGQESDLYWVVFIDETGESWMYSNKEIRAQRNVTLGRKLDTKVNYNKYPHLGTAKPFGQSCLNDRYNFSKDFDNFVLSPNATYSPAQSYNIDGR